MTASKTRRRVELDIDLHASGRQVGDIRIRWSDNRRPLGHYAVPVICLGRGEGPILLLTGAVHGDEFEGPVALMRLVQQLDPEQIEGRLVVIPALNSAALCESSRVSPLDGVNLNRAFPGDPGGGPTQMLAEYVESVLLPECDAAIDLHSGGKASVFAPCVLAQLDGDNGTRNRALAEAFGAPYLWVSGNNNDDRSLNAAAARQGVAMIAAELGGGGGCAPQMTDLAEAGLKRCLNHLGMTELPVESGEYPETLQHAHTLVAPARGLFDRRVSAGERVEPGQVAGYLHFADDPKRESEAVKFESSGRILAHTNRGFLERGDLVAMLARPWDGKG